jgi:hypothetical protein
MGKLVKLPRPRRPKVPPRSLLDAQIASLTAECTDRVELLEGLPHVFAGLVEIVPTARRAELSRSLCYLTHELDLTSANLRTVLICALVLYDKYTAESAA